MGSFDRQLNQGIRPQLGIFETPELKQQIPLGIFDSKRGMNTKVLQFEWDGFLPKKCVTDIYNYAVISTNIGAERGVLPCKSSLRKRNLGQIFPMGDKQGIYTQSIQTRGQPRSLYYDANRSVNLPLMPIADNFNTGLLTKIPQAPLIKF